MSKAEKQIPCYECSKLVSGKKAFECHDCGEVYCKEHIKLNEKDHSSTCMSCFRKKIHLEVTLEMESATLDAKTQLSTLKEKLKNCKKDLSTKKANIERHQNQIKITEKAYMRKFENLEKKTEEEIQRGVNIKNTAENFELTLNDCKEEEKRAQERLNEVADEHSSALFEFEALKQENNKFKSDILTANLKSKSFIPYSRLRNTLCPNCKNKIKLVFREEIMEGNRDKQSVIQSVLAEKEKHQMKKSHLGISEPTKKDDKACCSLF